jgi:hypothetical protein
VCSQPLPNAAVSSIAITDGTTQAQAHLRSKYDALTAANRIQTAEDCIDRAATKSSTSGQAYAIRCNNDLVVPTDRWLRDLLARYRSPTR